MKKSASQHKDIPAEKLIFKFFNSNKKTIRDYKNYHLGMQGYILSNKNFMIKPASKNEFKQREEDVKDLELSVDALYLVKEAEEYQRNNRMINCKFKLYKKAKAYIIANTYQTPYRRKKINKTFHFMPNGLPIKTRKKEYKYRNKFEFSDYELIDEGVFKQVFDEIRGSKISYKGKIYNFRIKYHEIESDKKRHKKTYRIKMLRFEKR